jgi:trehalose 6-phosphate synthase
MQGPPSNEADTLREAALRASLAELLARGASSIAPRSATSEAPAAARAPGALPAAASVAPPSTTPPPGLLIVVANRLPVTVSRDAATGEYVFKMSSGGLVSALTSVRSTLPFVWVGWLGQEVPEADRPALKRRLLTEHRCLPVWVSDDLAERF